MPETIYLTAVSVTAAWSDADVTAASFVFDSAAAQGRTHVVRLRGPLVDTPAQRQLLAAGPWSEVCVHSSAENADVWTASRIAASRADHRVRGGELVTQFAGHEFANLTVMIEVGDLHPADVYWSAAQGPTTVVATRRLGRVTRLESLAGGTERLDSDTVVPLLSRDHRAQITGRDVLDWGRGVVRECTLATSA